MTGLVTKEAIDFTAKAILADGTICNNFNLKEQLYGKYGVLFFYPLNFTFVCPTEIIAFHNRMAAFSERNTVVIGISIDSHFSHLAWRNTPIKNGGIGEINFPLVSDISKSISKNYEVLIEDSIALRATIIIDKDFIVRHVSINDLPLGRNVDEILRIIDAVQYNEQYGEVCPAGWNRAKEGMKATAESAADYLASNKNDL